MTKRKHYTDAGLTESANPLLNAQRDVADIEPHRITRRRQKDPQGESRRKVLRKETAATALGGLQHGTETFILSRGQFSVAELLEVVLELTGPAELDISTWTAARAEIDDAYKLIGNGKVLACRWLFDISFKARNPDFFAQVCRLFGADAVRQCWNHVKLALIGNAEWQVVVLTSANLNKNPRLEYYIVREGREFYEWNRAWFGDFFPTR